MTRRPEIGAENPYQKTCAMNQHENTALSYSLPKTATRNKKLSCCRETARRFVLLNIFLSHKVTQGHSKSTLLSRTCVSPYSFIETTSVCRTVYQIFSVEEWSDLETGGRGRSRSLKMAPFDRSYTTFYWSAIVSIAVCCTIFKLFDVE